VLKQRIAGKSLPVEKFAVKKSVRYFEQDRHLTLPAYVRYFLPLLLVVSLSAINC